MEEFLIISEPWNFTSSDGNNQIKVKKIFTDKDYLVYKCLSQYENKSEFLLLEERDKNGNYNIYQISDYLKVDFNDLKISMIGRFNSIIVATR